MTNLYRATELAGRIGIALIFLLSGASKIGSYESSQGYMESMGVPGILLPAVILLEIAGSLALMIGWKTRIMAAALAGFTILAAIIFHTDFADQMQMMLFLKNIAIAGGLLIVFSVGAGAYSLDEKRFR